MDSEFFNSSSIKRFGLARILVERRLFSSGKLETLGTELSEISCGGKICSAGGVTPWAKRTFQTILLVVVGLALAKTQFTGSSLCLGSKSGTFKPASSRSSVINVSFPKQFSYLHSVLDRTLSILNNSLSPRSSPISVIPCENWFTNFETALDHRVKAS